MGYEAVWRTKQNSCTDARSQSCAQWNQGVWVYQSPSRSNAFAPLSQMSGLSDSLPFLHTWKKKNTHTHTHTYKIHTDHYSQTKAKQQKTYKSTPTPPAHIHSAIWPKSLLIPKQNPKAFIAPFFACTNVLYLNFNFFSGSLHLCFFSAVSTLMAQSPCNK